MTRAQSFKQILPRKITLLGSCCGSVVKAVASGTRGTRFESSHRQILYLLSVNCVERTKVNGKEAGNDTLKILVLWSNS